MLEYALIILFIVCQAFFSGSETGFYSFNRVRLRFRQHLSWPGAAALSRLSARPRLAITTMLIGTNVCVFLSTVLCAGKIHELGTTGHADLYSSVIMPPILLIFAEVTPKSLFQRRADTLMYRTAGLLNVFEVLFWPVLLVQRGIVAVARAVSRRPVAGDEGVFTRDKLRFLLKEGAALGLLSQYQEGMANNLMRLRSLSVCEAMVPLDDVVMAPQEAGLDELRAVLRDHRFSRIPLYEGSRDNITGVVNVIDLLCASAGGAATDVLHRGPLYLDAQVSVAEALYALKKAGQQMAVVMAAEGQAMGIVTVKDLVEEIVGELHAW